MFYVRSIIVRAQVLGVEVDEIGVRCDGQSELYMGGGRLLLKYKLILFICLKTKHKSLGQNARMDGWMDGNCPENTPKFVTKREMMECCIF